MVPNIVIAIVVVFVVVTEPWSSNEMASRTRIQSSKSVPLWRFSRTRRSTLGSFQTSTAWCKAIRQNSHHHAQQPCRLSCTFDHLFLPLLCSITQSPNHSLHPQQCLSQKMTYRSLAYNIALSEERYVARKILSGILNCPSTSWTLTLLDSGFENKSFLCTQVSHGAPLCLWKWHR
jgi:hypothetical protein